jgi:hypothetical protein
MTNVYRRLAAKFRAAHATNSADRKFNQQHAAAWDKYADTRDDIRAAEGKRELEAKVAGHLSPEDGRLATSRSVVNGGGLN